MVVPKHIRESTFYVNKCNKTLPFRLVPSTTVLEVFPVAPSRTVVGKRCGKLPLHPCPADRQEGQCDKGGREPASAPKVLFVCKDVLMKCIGSLLIWKLGEGESRAGL